jgi:hypothetical protein
MVKNRVLIKNGTAGCYDNTLRKDSKKMDNSQDSTWVHTLDLLRRRVLEHNRRPGP